MSSASNGWVIYSKPGEKAFVLRGIWSQFELNQIPPLAFVVQPWELSAGKVHALIPDSVPQNLESIATTSLGTELEEGETKNFATQSEFKKWVEVIIESIERGQMQKCVAARREWNDKSIDNEVLSHLISKLFQSSISGMKVCMFHPALGLWMGISPEVFCSGDHNRYFSMSLAGTVADKESSFTDKESLEQNIVTGYISDQINSHTGKLLGRHTTPEAYHAAHLTHLMSKIEFEMEPAKVDGFLLDMHPTPAVGGFPKDSALDLIRSNEHFDRELYSGWWGLKEGDKIDYYVNLRCAKLFSNGYVSYAGCGINSGSVPEKEWQETVQKMRVIQGVLNG